jgi:hypothetical protein
MVDEFVIRIGTFFIVIGVGIFILFVASDYANQTNFDYLFWSVLSITLGLLFRRRKPPPPPSGRFSIIHRKRGEHKGHRDEKK